MNCVDHTDACSSNWGGIPSGGGWSPVDMGPEAMVLSHVLIFLPVILPMLVAACFMALGIVKSLR